MERLGCWYVELGMERSLPRLVMGFKVLSSLVKAEHKYGVSHFESVPNHDGCGPNMIR